MNDPSDWPRRLKAPRRNNFFFGKMMGVDQFEREQRYGMRQRWLMNRLTLGTGILFGLEVTTDGQRIHVTQGVAVDPWGREIVVPRPVVDYNPFAPGGGCGCSDEPVIAQAGVYTLCLRYRECTADGSPVSYNEDCPGQPDCQPDTVVETFSLGMRSGPPPAATFDCAQWSAPVPNPAPPPPTSADLRKRLAAQLAGARGPLPEDPCVVLGLVTVTAQPDGTLSLSASNDDPRVYIHSQAQLLDVVLCLAETVAKCCGAPHVVPPPPTIDPPTVTALRFLRLEAAQLTEVSPRPGMGPPVFDARENPPRSGQWDPIHLRTSFSKPIDGANITSPSNQPRGFEVTFAPPGGGASTIAAVDAIFEQPNIVLMTCQGDPGAYVLTLRGDQAGPSQTPILSWDPDSTKRKRLDGEFTGQLPSGDTIEGGDFVYAFEIQPEVPPPPPPPPPPPLETFRIRQIELMHSGQVIAAVTTLRDTEVRTIAEVDSFRVVFNAPVDLASAELPGAVTAAVLGGAPVIGTISLDGPNAFVYGARGGFRTGNYEVKLLGQKIKDKPPGPVAARTLDGEPGQLGSPLPSGNGTGGGDFTFYFKILP